MNFILKLAVGAVLVGIFSAVFFYDTVTYRYRLTLEADTPGGIRSASGVLEVESTEIKWGFMEMRGVSHQLKGDAIILDLGRGKHIIAVLGTGERGEQGLDYMALRAFQRMRSNVVWSNVGNQSGRIPLDIDLMPTLIRFEIMNDPSTAQIVYAWGRKIETTRFPGGSQDYDRGPELKVDDFESHFGLGYRFRGAYIEVVPVGWWPLNLIGITGVPITRGIDSKLPWLKTLRGYLNGNTVCGPSEIHCLRRGHFQRL